MCFGKDVPESNISTGMGMMGRMHQGMMGDETDIERFKNAADFDKVFIEEMKQLAQNIIDAQTREINSMRSWYQDWY